MKSADNLFDKHRPQALESTVLARQRQADHRVVADKGQAARVAGAKAHRGERPRCRIDPSKAALARVQQPEPAIVQARRMRHREAVGHHLVLESDSKLTE